MSLGEYIVTTEAAEIPFNLSSDEANRFNNVEFSALTWGTGKLLRLKNGQTPYEIPAFNNNSRIIIKAARVEIIGANGLRPIYGSSSSVVVAYPIEIKISRLITNQTNETEEQRFFLHNFGEWEEQNKEFLPLPELDFFNRLKLARLRFDYDSLAMQDIFRGAKASAVVMLKVLCAGIASELA